MRRYVGSVGCCLKVGKDQYNSIAIYSCSSLSWFISSSWLSLTHGIRCLRAGTLKCESQFNVAGTFAILFVTLIFFIIVLLILLIVFSRLFGVLFTSLYFASLQLSNYVNAYSNLFSSFITQFSDSPQFFFVFFVLAFVFFKNVLTFIAPTVSDVYLALLVL